MTTAEFEDLCRAKREAWRKSNGLGAERDRLPVVVPTVPVSERIY